MSQENSTIQWKYRVKHEIHPRTAREWAVYRDGYALARFYSHERALSYAIQQADAQHVDDWQVVALEVAQQWIMVVINEKRRVWQLIDRAPKHERDNIDSIKRWCTQKPLKWRIKRTGMIVEWQPIISERILKGHIDIGEWYQYE